MYFDKTYRKAFYRPSDDIDPEKKQNDPLWNKEWAEFIYSEYLLGRCAITPSDVSRFDVNHSYAVGRQNTDLYKDLILDEFSQDPEGPNYQPVTDSFNPPVNKKARSGWVSINFENVFSPMPKYTNTIIGIMEGEDHDIQVAALDESSGDLREEIKYKRYVNGKFLTKLAFYDKEMGIENQDEETVYPNNIEELGMFEQMGEFKLAYEIGIQRALDHTMKASNDKKLKRNVIKDIIKYGITATMDYFDYNIGEVRAKHLDVRNLILENSKEDDFSDITYAGYIEYVSIATLKAETGMSDDDLYSIANNYVGDFGNSTSYSMTIQSDGFYDFYKCKVPVLVAKWLSNDTSYHTTRKTTDGNEVDFPEPYRKRKDGTSKLPRVYQGDEKKTTKTTSQSLYGCKWVIGADVVYHFGKEHDVAFDYSNKRVQIPIQAYKIDEKPIIENCIPVVDQIALTFYRLQNGIAKAPPPGLKIEYNSMMGMTFEDDQEWKPLDGLRLYTQTGHMIFNASPSGVELPPNMPAPIEELRGGLGTVIDDAAKSLELAYSSLMEITGIDRLSAVSQSPNRDQGKYVTEVAVAATTNTLRSVYACHLSMKEMLARSIALRVQAVVVGRDDNKYNKIIGDAAVEAFRSAEHTPPIALGVHLVATPDDVMKNTVREAATAALAGGKNGIPALTYSEYLFIMEQLNTMAGISYARIYIARKEAESQARQQQASEQNQKLLSEETMRQNQQKIEAEQAKVEMEKNKELEILDKKGTIDMDLERLKHENKMRELELQTTKKE